MKKIRVAINGFGRIGRAFFKLAFERPEIEIVAVNDLGDLDNLAYLLKYDTVYRTSNLKVSTSVSPEPAFIVDGNKVLYLSQKDPAQLPWKDLAIDVVVESSGFFASYTGSEAHIQAGAKKVVITAPTKDEPTEAIAGATILLGVNEEKFKGSIITSNASCTTNAASPVIAILHESIGIEKAILNTVHGYTATQALVDSPAGKKGYREGRAAAENIIPSSTGAAIAVTKAFPALTGLFDGVSIRVPVPAGSIADITFIAKRPTTKEEVNELLKQASMDPRWKNIFTVTEDQIVSSDILGSQYASIADLEMTRVVGGTLVKVLAWYDNEMGYTRTLVDHVVKAGEMI
ncbi:MAG: type I glyceraldehyde-3-phosphate dehydrogenase [Candidatus Pacebacteria bacterium]|jgi:glyceraldehyde 3-phosphate dehydrogenase|nr:type I glyceraldehyde-3-phosphate dehydrogenase [Candidatus Paceibacterota bacterium]